MGDYLHNTMFVEDLVEFYFKATNRSWKATDSVHDFKNEFEKSPFDPDIGFAFLNTYCEFHKHITALCLELRTKGGITDRATFSRYALNEAYLLFTEGYTHECFLAYCVHVLGIASTYYVFSEKDILESAVQVIALVLFSHQMTEDLMTYIFEKHSLIYIPRSKSETEKYRKHSAGLNMSPFRLIIGNAIYIGIAKNTHELSIMFQQEFELTLDALSFRRHVMKLVPEWFPEGYHPICFIEFCIMVCFTALSFYEAGYRGISSYAGEIIAVVLTQQMLKGDFMQKGGWEKLVKISTEIVIVDRQTSVGDGK
ncbi:hypothetical protein HNY73_008707 [Argiope bruennichi]|uniref:Uncharacterized protein n=1 Tax=Argiope bruennichi TaxID=94029 RepID=A0A8T0F7B7_ARGBR|nr:hypothetical protein HNY73_008707 [Argiope bruennichi]